MKKYFLLIGILFLTSCGISVVKESSNRGLIIPAYFYDSDLWQKVIDADADIVAIVNPDNGPGNSKDSFYTHKIEDLIAKGKKPVGYVYTTYAQRNIEIVKDEIDKWIEFYPKIEGFFIDEVTSDAVHYDYYSDLKDYILSKGDYYIVLNPGTMPNAVYFSLADNIVVYEGNASLIPNKTCETYTDKSSIIVYDANETQMKDILYKYRCRYLYVTDDSGSNPYDTLPGYFDEEIKLLK